MLARYLLLSALLCVVSCADEVSWERADGGDPTSDDAQGPVTAAAQLDSSAAGEAEASARSEDAGRLDAAPDGSPARPDAAARDAQPSASDAANASDAPSATADASAPCNALRPNMFSASLGVSPGQPPEPQRGGMIYDGTYRLDEATVYDPDPNRAHGVPEMRVETLKIEGNVWQHVAYWNGEPTTRFTHRSSLRENFFSLGLSCGSEFDARVFGGLPNLSSGFYTALPQMLTLQVIGGGEAGHVYVLKYLRIE